MDQGHEACQTLALTDHNTCQRNEHELYVLIKDESTHETSFHIPHQVKISGVFQLLFYFRHIAVI